MVACQGVEGAYSQFACDKMFQVVNCRYEARKPSIFTTNLAYESMKASNNISLARIFERILERSVPCTFTVDRRQANRDAMVKEFQAKLTANGIEDIIKEAQSQLDAWRTANK